MVATLLTVVAAIAVVMLASASQIQRNQIPPRRRMLTWLRCVMSERRSQGHLPAMNYRKTSLLVKIVEPQIDRADPRREAQLNLQANGAAQNGKMKHLVTINQVFVVQVIVLTDRLCIRYLIS